MAKKNTKSVIAEAFNKSQEPIDFANFRRDFVEDEVIVKITRDSVWKQSEYEKNLVKEYVEKHVRSCDKLKKCEINNVAFTFALNRRDAYISEFCEEENYEEELTKAEEDVDKEFEKIKIEIQKEKEKKRNEIYLRRY